MGSAESKVAAQPPPLAVVATAGGHQRHSQTQSVVGCNFLRKQNKTAPACMAAADVLSSPTMEAVKEAKTPSSPSAAASPSISTETSLSSTGPTAQLLAANKALGLHQLSFEELSTQLLKAVKNGDLKLVERITEICATKQLPSIINIRGMWDSTPLIYACQYCHEPIALWLLRAGADAQLVNEKGVTALLLASLEGMAAAVQQMLATRGSGSGSGSGDGSANGGELFGIDAQVGVVYNSMTDVNVRASPLLAASMNGHVEIVRMLLQHGAKVNCGVSCTGAKPAPSSGGGGGGGAAGGRGALQFPLLAAVKYGHSAVAQLLIQQGADIGKSDGTENHALLLACESAKEDCALALLRQLPLADHGIWKRSNCHGFTALHYCAVHGLVKTAEWMLRQLQWENDLAFLNATSSTRHESAVLMASRKKQVEMVKLLVQCGANAALADRGGTTALDVLKREKRDELVALWQHEQQQHEQQRIQKDNTEEIVADGQATTPAREMPRGDAMVATNRDAPVSQETPSVLFFPVSIAEAMTSVVAEETANKLVASPTVEGAVVVVAMPDPILWDGDTKLPLPATDDEVFLSGAFVNHRTASMRLIPVYPTEPSTTAVVATTTTTNNNNNNNATTAPPDDTQDTSDQTADSQPVVSVSVSPAVEAEEVPVPGSVSSPAASPRKEREKHKKKKRHSRKKVAESDDWSTSEPSVSATSATAPAAESAVRTTLPLENKHNNDDDHHQKATKPLVVEPPPTQANSNDRHDHKGDLDDDF